MSKQYAVLIADIKSSRTLKSIERFDAQEKLYKIVEVLNDVFSKDLSLSISFSAGDSIQGLFTNLSSSLRCFYLLRELFSPNSIRCGIGIGSINSKIYRESNLYFEGGNTNFVDGEAYHFAKEALDVAKAKNVDVLVFSLDVWNDSLTNNSLLISSSFRKRITNSQKELLDICDLINPLLTLEQKYIFKKYFNKCVDFLSFDKKFFESYMDAKDFYRNLMDIFELNLEFNNSNNNYYQNVFEADITQRNIDAYLAKLFNVSSQNIWLLRKRGFLKEIRTQELLALLCLERNYHG